MSTPLEIEALARLGKTTVERVRPFAEVVALDFTLSPNEADDLFTVPAGRCAAVTRIDFDSIPEDGAGNLVFSERRAGIYADTFNLSFAQGGNAQGAAKDYRFYSGEVFLVFSAGLVRVQLDRVFPAGDGFIFIRLFGYVLPRTAETALRQYDMLTTL